MPDLYLTLNRSGIKTWAILYYVRGKPRRRKVGFFPPMSQAGFPSLKVEQARAIASKVDVDEEIKIKPGTFGAEAEKWFAKQVEARKLRTAGEIRRQLNKYVLPHWRDRLFLEIRLGEVNDLLDTIENKHGARCADLVLATIRSLFNWFSLEGMTTTPRPSVRAWHATRRVSTSATASSTMKRLCGCGVPLTSRAPSALSYRCPC